MANPPLKLDRKSLLGGGGGGREETLELEVVSRKEFESKPAQNEHLGQISDRDLEDKIQRLQSLIDGDLKSKLNDFGAKLRSSLQNHFDERERRKLLRLQKDDDGCARPTQSQNSRSFDILSPESSIPIPSDEYICPPFYLTAGRQGKKPDSATHVASDAFTEERGYLGSVKPKSPMQDEFWAPKETRRSKMCSRRRPSPVQTSIDLKKSKAQTVVLLDEEDAVPMDKVEQENETNTLNKETKIYYPSRNHPESVEICFSDMDCLAPQSYLSSPIMNFYIQYLQRSECVADRMQADYHFFSTYFYKKLEEALSFKRRIDNKDSFIKFRRWWKGVNLFQKAYIFLPIHSDQHWSLVIICIPPLEDESGPIILHLDSLGIHSSSLIFSNVERYLTEEWKYLNDNAASLDLPISDKIWKRLPSKVKTRKIEVPQQKNDYDCGLFVLFFMEKFIEDAPERVRKKNLDMFGRRWFQPEQASDLRKHIRSLLWKEFEKGKPEKSEERSTPGSPTVSLGRIIKRGFSISSFFRIYSIFSINNLLFCIISSILNFM